MRKKRDISILDVTIRDGSYSINYQYTPRQVAEVSGALDRAGIDYIEVSHGCGLGAAENLGFPSAASDADYVKAAKAAVLKAKVGVIAGPSPVTQERDIDSIIREVDFIRFAANCDNPGILEKNADYARKRRPGIALFMQMMRSTRRPKRDLIAAARRAESMGFSIVYLVDTAGHFVPEEVEDLIAALSAKLSIGVGFHGHDNLRLAVANSMAAVEAGAVSVDASLRGIGRAAGNAQMECLVSLLKRVGYVKNVDLAKLLEAGEKIIAPVMPPRRGVEALDVATADANIDIYPLEPYERIAAKLGVSIQELIDALGGDPSTVEFSPSDAQRLLGKRGAGRGKSPRR